MNYSSVCTDFSNKKSKILGDFIALISGVPLVLATAPFNWYFLALFSPMLLWFSLNNISNKRAIWRGWLFGFGLYGSGTHWVYVSLFNYGLHQVLPSVFLTFILVAFLATFTAFWTWIWNKFLSNSFAVIYFAFWWILMEAFRGWFLTGFPWLFLGTTQLDSPLAGYIPLVGVYGVSAIVVAISLSIAKILFPSKLVKNLDFKKAYKITPYRMNLLAFLILSIALGLVLDRIEWTKPNGKILDIGMVQPSIPQDRKWNFFHFNELVETYTTETNKLKGADIIIWPESALPILASSVDNILNKIMQNQENHTQLVLGVVGKQSSGTYYNGLLEYKNKQLYKKVHLVPFGEFIPFRDSLKNTFNFFNLPMARFVPAQKNQPALNLGNTKVAPLICYEVTYSDYAASQAHNSNWLLTLSNDAWFGDSLGPYQHAQIARFRAAEARLPMVRVTNDGLTFITDTKGKIVKQLERFKIATLRAELEAYEGSTPYAKLGNSPLLIIAVLVLIFGAWRNRSAKPKKII